MRTKSLSVNFVNSSIAFLLLHVIGCSSAPTGPVASAPLSGKIGGQAFAGKIALATSSDTPSGKWIHLRIYESDVKCGVFGTPEGRAVLMSPAEWKDGLSYDLGAGGEATLFAPPSSNTIATIGRVEVISIGSSFLPGKVRVRAIYDGNNTVEGEVPVYSCM